LNLDADSIMNRPRPRTLRELLFLISELRKRGISPIKTQDNVAIKVTMEILGCSRRKARDYWNTVCGFVMLFIYVNPEPVTEGKNQ